MESGWNGMFVLMFRYHFLRTVAQMISNEYSCSVAGGLSTKAEPPLEVLRDFVAATGAYAVLGFRWCNCQRQKSFRVKEKG